MPNVSFDPGIEDIADERSQLPEGWYRGQLIDSRFQDFKNGNGTSLVFTFNVEHNGLPRRVMSFNTWKHNTSAEAQKWGQIAVKQFMRAVGKGDAQSTDECHNIPLDIFLQEGEKYNKVSRYRTAKSSTPDAAPGAQAVAITQQAQTFNDDVIPF
jgi:hypothetical protein